jgi:cysteine desulfurase
VLVYLDCNATAPMEPETSVLVAHWMAEDYGNAGSRTHIFGARAKQAVQMARDQVATIVDAHRDDVVFTSGATESNNLALLGLAPFGERHGKRHIVSTAIEHKAVLEPLAALRRGGFEVTLIDPEPGGYVSPERVRAALRSDTLLISLMHVNNETGVEQPLEAISREISDHGAYFHVDAAQGFGKSLQPLRTKRIDLISVSGHKIYGPKGIGALITRRRGFEHPPLAPLQFGGGQERGLRPGTLPVPLIVGFGKAAELAHRDHRSRQKACLDFRQALIGTFEKFDPEFNGDQNLVLPHVVNLSIPGLDAEAFILATKELIAVSNGSACTSQRYEISHVLTAMRLPNDRIQNAVRLSWCHMTRRPDWFEVAQAIQRVR